MITILITDFTLIEGSSAYHNRFKLRNVEGTAEFGDIIEINTLELSKLPQEKSWNNLIIWLEFFRAKTKEDFMKLASMNPQVERAVVIIRELSKDEQAHFIAERDEKIRLDLSSMKNYAFSQGILEGKQAGRLEGLQEGVAQGLQQGISQGPQQGISQCLQKGKQEAHADILKLINEGLTAEQIRERLSDFAE